MQLTKNTNRNYTVRQLKLPLEIEKVIDISVPVYTFCDVFGIEYKHVLGNDIELKNMHNKGVSR